MFEKLGARFWAMIEAKRAKALDEMRGDADTSSADLFAAVNLLSGAGGANAAAAALPARPKRCDHLIGDKCAIDSFVSPSLSKLTGTSNSGSEGQFRHWNRICTVSTDRATQQKCDSFRQQRS